MIVRLMAATFEFVARFLACLCCRFQNIIHIKRFRKRFVEKSLIYIYIYIYFADLISMSIKSYTCGVLTSTFNYFFSPNVFIYLRRIRERSKRPEITGIDYKQKKVQRYE